MAKKIISIILSIIFCISLTACENETDEKQEFYMRYFLKNYTQFQRGSITIDNGEDKIQFIKSPNGDRKYIANVVKDGETSASDFYFIGDKMYARILKNDIEQWYICEDEKIITEYSSTINEITSIENLIPKDWETVTYLETNDNIDSVSVRTKYSKKSILFKIDSTTNKIISALMLGGENKTKGTTMIFEDKQEFDFVPPENPKKLKSKQ